MNKYICEFVGTKKGNDNFIIIANNQNEASILAKGYLESDYAKTFGHILNAKLKANEM